MGGVETYSPEHGNGKCYWEGHLTGQKPYSGANDGNTDCKDHRLINFISEEAKNGAVSAMSAAAPLSEALD